MQIASQPLDIIMQKLQKIRCSQDCQNGINYLLLISGLYCSSCLSTIPHVNQRVFINCGELAEVMLEIVGLYRKGTRGTGSYYHVMKEEMDGVKNQIKRCQDGVKQDGIIVKKKLNQKVDKLFNECERQNRNQGLEKLYQQDLSLGDDQLLKILVNNLQDIEINYMEQEIIGYKIKQNKKNCQIVNTRIEKQYDNIIKLLQQAISQKQYRNKYMIKFINMYEIIGREVFLQFDF